MSNRPAQWRESRFQSPRALIGVLYLSIAAGCSWVAAGCGGAPMGIETIEELQGRGQFEQTIEPLRKLIGENPEDSKALYYYSRALASSGRPGQSIWASRLAMADPEYLKPAGKLFIQTLIRGDAFGDAIEVCNEILEELGEDAEVLALRSVAKQGSRKDYEGAIADADRVLELDPDNVDVLIPRTVSLLTLERVEEAAQALRDLDDLYKDESMGIKGSGKFCTAGAVFAWEKGEPDLALERFEYCLTEFPGDSVLLPRALSFFDQKKDYERTLEILRGALAIKPDEPRIRQNLALRLDALGRREEAIETLRDATEHESPVSQINAWATLAAFYAGTDDLEASLAAYDEALKRSTVRSPELDFRYADTLIQAGRFEEALAWSEKMTVPAQRSLIQGRVYLSTDRPAEALDRLTDGNRLWPNNAIARYYTAVAAEQAGDLERAVEEYRYSIRIEPTATDAPIRLAQYNLALGDPGRAIGILTSSISGGSGSKRIEMELLLARILSVAGRWRTANPTYLQMVMTPQRRGETMLAVAEGLRDRTEIASAIQFLEEVPNMDLSHPWNAPVLTKMVEWLPLLGRQTDALVLAQAARSAQPKFAPFQAAYAFALAASGGPPDEAAAAFVKALEMDPGNALAARGYAAFLEGKESNADQVLDLYRKAVETDPSDVTSAKKLASLHRSRNEEQAAVTVLNELVERRPWDADALLSLASFLLDVDAPTAKERAGLLIDRARKLSRGPRNLGPELEQIGKRFDAVSGTGTS